MALLVAIVIIIALAFVPTFLTSLSLLRSCCLSGRLLATAAKVAWPGWGFDYRRRHQLIDLLLSIFLLQVDPELLPLLLLNGFIFAHLKSRNMDQNELRHRS